MSLTVNNGKVRLPMLLNEDMIGLSVKQKNQYYKDNGLERSYIKTKLTSNDKIKQLRIIDRKSTRLNSSHANISYAVFCLKKKNTNITYTFIYITKKKTI